MAAPRLREGFAGQQMFVIPRPVLRAARVHPLLQSICPTDVGWYPRARHHYRDRPSGAPEDHLMLCVGGHGFVEVDERRHELRAGELLIIPRHRRHTYWAADDAPWHLYWMHFVGEDVGYYLERTPGPGIPLAAAPTAQREAVRLFRSCLAGLDAGYSLQNLIYAAQVASHILATLLYFNAAVPRRSTSAAPSRLEATTEFMLRNLAKPMRLKDFAEHAGCSVSHFNEWFRDESGETPVAHFTHLRIRAACRLLDMTTRPIKAVALETGYPDPYHFSRAFRKVMGVSPKNYRSIHKG